MPPSQTPVGVPIVTCAHVKGEVAICSSSGSYSYSSLRAPGYSVARGWDLLTHLLKSHSIFIFSPDSRAGEYFPGQPLNYRAE